MADEQKPKRPEIVHHDPVEVRTAGGKHHIKESSEATYRGDDGAENPRHTKEGRAADQKARGTMFADTGWAPGHHHGLSRGVDPADGKNITPQNALQNGGGGTYWNMERARDKELKDNPDLQVTETVETTYSPDREGYGTKVPISRRVIHERSDGTKSGENVHYGNFSSSASRRADALAAEGKKLEPREALSLTAKDRENLRGHGEGPRNPEEERRRELFVAGKDPEKRRAMKAEMKNMAVEGGKNKPDPEKTR